MLAPRQTGGFTRSTAAERCYSSGVEAFRAKLVATLRAVAPVLEEPGVLVIGSEVPNLLQGHAAATLVISQDVDIGIPVACHARIKQRLKSVRRLMPSREEPSVWVPCEEGLIEVNFLGMDPAITDASETYVLADDELPLLVFGQLSLMRPGTPIALEGGLVVPVPRAAGLMLEKLITDRSGEKGDRDLLVVAGLLITSTAADLEELAQAFWELSAELQHAVRSSLTVLSLMAPHAGMPDPRPLRQTVARLLARLDGPAESTR